MAITHEKAINWRLLMKKLYEVFFILMIPALLVFASFLLSKVKWENWIKLDSFNAYLVLDYLRVLIWPFVVLCAILVLKPHLPVLVRNLKRLRGAGLSADFNSSQQGVSGPEITELRESENSRQPAEDTDPDTGVDAETANLLKSPEAKLAYSEVYDKIFGSQLNTLKRLARNVPEGLTADDLQDIYESHTSTADPSYPSFVAFIQYLIDNTLVKYDVSDKRYKLTNAGLYFLLYLDEKNILESFKPY